jgi:hypothetical protein
MIGGILSGIQTMYFALPRQYFTLKMKIDNNPEKLFPQPTTERYHQKRSEV